MWWGLYALACVHSITVCTGCGITRGMEWDFMCVLRLWYRGSHSHTQCWYEMWWGLYALAGYMALQDIQGVVLQGVWNEILCVYWGCDTGGHTVTHNVGMRCGGVCMHWQVTWHCRMYRVWYYKGYGMRFYVRLWYRGSHSTERTGIWYNVYCVQWVVDGAVKNTNRHGCDVMRLYVLIHIYIHKTWVWDGFGGKCIMVIMHGFMFAAINLKWKKRKEIDDMLKGNNCQMNKWKVFTNGTKWKYNVGAKRKCMEIEKITCKGHTVKWQFAKTKQG